MKELREIDIDGAPLLFHAASSRGEHSCFWTTYDLITMVLGKGGLTEQVEAVDGHDRGILMHAARSNHVEIFRKVFGMCKEASDSLKLRDNFEPAAAAVNVDGQQTPPDRYRFCLSSRRQKASIAPPATDGVWELIGKPDSKGMTCLHHVAEAGCFALLREVKEKCREAGISLKEEMGKADMNERTPMMYVLRNDAYYGANNLSAKFDMLYEHAEEGWMTQRPVQPQPVLASSEAKAIETRAVTELMHAARGGLASLELALTNSRHDLKEDSDDGFTVDLDKALDLEELKDDQWQSNINTKTWGRALLLAAAAKLGDVDVLYYVLDAIKVS